MLLNACWSWSFQLLLSLNSSWRELKVLRKRMHFLLLCFLFLMIFVKFLKKVSNSHILLIFGCCFRYFRHIYLSSKLLCIELNWFVIIWIFKNFVNIVFWYREFFFLFNLNIDFERSLVNFLLNNFDCFNFFLSWLFFCFGLFCLIVRSWFSFYFVFRKRYFDNWSDRFRLPMTLDLLRVFFVN